MKPRHTIAGLALALAAPLTFAQTPSQVQGQTPSSGPTPAPIVIDTKVDLTTEPGPPADLNAARHEAVAALAWAKSEGCRSDPSPRDCIRRAQDEYNRVMAQLGARR